MSERSLQDIAAVQVLYGGFERHSVEIGDPGTPGSVLYRSWHSYQLNLVLNDPEEPRVNLTSHSDVTWMREAGQRIAEFLNVPLIDHA